MAESESGKVKLPSKKEVENLPRLARIAFAARCARRVQMLYKHLWPHASQDDLNDADAAVTFTETLGAGASGTDTAFAAHTAHAAPGAALAAFTTHAAHNVARAVAAMRRDCELLQAVAADESWTSKTPVPPEFFGPLWPEGVPEGWPIEGAESNPESAELVIELEVPDNADEDEVTERLSKLVAEMDGMHRAMGGGGLKVSGVDVEVVADRLIGVSS